MIIVRNVYTAIRGTHPVPTAGRKANRRVRTMVEKPTDGEKPRPLAIEKVEPPDITAVPSMVAPEIHRCCSGRYSSLSSVLGLQCWSIRISGGPADGLLICV